MRQQQQDTVITEEFLNFIPPSERNQISKTLSSAMPRGREELFFRDKPNHLNKSKVNNKKHIVFVCYYSNPSLAKKSLMLRQSNNFYTTLICCCIREDTEPLEYFDEVYEVRDYVELILLLADCQASCLHALIHPWIFGALANFAKKRTGIKSIIELGDSMLFISHEPTSRECCQEQWVLAGADWLIHRMPEEAITEIRETWDINIPDSQIQCLPQKDLFQQYQPSPVNSPLKLVFAGGLIPPGIAKERGHEGHLFFPLINKVCNTDCQLTFYVNKNARNMFWDEHDYYREYDRKLHNFHFRHGVPFFKLPSSLAGFDMGIYYENSSASSYNPKHFKYNMATKIFSYIESGLPLLVPDTATYMKDFVNTFEIGEIYQFEYLEKTLLSLAKEPLKLMTYATNVEIYRNQHEICSTAETLDHIYNN